MTYARETSSGYSGIQLPFTTKLLSDCNFSGTSVARDLGKHTQSFASSALGVSKRARFGPGPHGGNTLEIRAGWLSKTADSEAFNFREKHIYP